MPNESSSDSAQARSAALAKEPPDIAATPAPMSAGVFGMARTTAGSPPSACSRRWQGTPATIESTRRTPLTPSARQAPSAWSGFTASTAPRISSPPSAKRPGLGRGDDPHAGVRLLELLAPVVQRLDHGHGAGGVGAAAEQAAQQGAAHLPAADDQQVRHARDVTERGLPLRKNGLPMATRPARPG